MPPEQFRAFGLRWLEETRNPFFTGGPFLMTAPEFNDPDDKTSPSENGAKADLAAADAAAAELTAARKLATDNHDRYLRMAADLENFRRRTVREKDELRLFAASRVLEDLLPGLDNLSLGLAAARQPNADLKTLTGGVELVLQQLKAALAAHGLTEINPAGKAFDPHQHEALSHQASADVPPEHVLTVVRTGYVLNGRLLRPAAVIISSGPDKPHKRG
jgi:molecular chaperone GrpE